MKCGADIYARDNDGRTALTKATRNGRISCMGLLVKSGADVHSRDSDSLTVLIGSACLGELSSLEFLVKHGADVNARDYKGSTALMQTSDFAWVKFLVSKGAWVHAWVKDDDEKVSDFASTPYLGKILRC